MKPVSRQSEQGTSGNDGAASKLKTPGSAPGKVQKAVGKRGRKPSKIDQKVKLERSRQSARECRARKKQKYQLLEEMVASKERAILVLREELEMYKKWCEQIDAGSVPDEAYQLLEVNNSTSNKQPAEETP